MDVPDDTNSITSTTSAGVAVGNLLVSDRMCSVCVYASKQYVVLREVVNY